MCFDFEAASTQTGSVRFGIFDYEDTPGAGWLPLDLETMQRYKYEFISHYNSNMGINVIRPFKSGNCCFAIKHGEQDLMLTVTGTSYKFAFPASQSGSIRCNPSEDVCWLGRGMLTARTPRSARVKPATNLETES